MEGPGHHRGPEGITRQEAGAGHPGGKISRGTGHILHLRHAVTVNPGAMPHPPEIKTQGGPPPVSESPGRSPHDVIVHAAAVEGVGVGDDHARGRAARDEPGLEADLTYLQVNLLFH